METQVSETCKYFKDSEFACKCGCGKSDMDKDFVLRLDKAREFAGIPFVITSGCRCEKHNKAVKGSSTSSHLTGLAVDISAVTSSEKFAIVNALLDTGFTRIGVGNSFVHVDADTKKPQNVLWTY